MHREMFTDGLMHLHEAGKVTNAEKGLYPGVSVATFAAMRTEALYRWLEDNTEGGGAVVAAGMGKRPELPAPLSQILLGISGFATLLVLFRLFFTPDNDGGGIVDIGRSIGVFIALIAAVAILYGATQTTAETGPGAPPPAV